MSEFDPMRILDVLAAHGVEFVVIGGFAAELYRAPIPPTHDIDITPRLSDSNLARLSSALNELGARIRTSGGPGGVGVLSRWEITGSGFHLEPHDLGGRLRPEFSPKRN